MDISSLLVIAVLYLECVGVVTEKIRDDKENDMSSQEKFWWTLLAPIAVGFIIHHEGKNSSKE